MNDAPCPQIHLYCHCPRDDSAIHVERWRADLEPRAYSNTPIGLNFLVAGYTFTSGGVAIDASLPLKDAHIEVHGATLAYARSFELFGQSAKFDVVLPQAWLSGTAEFAGQPRERAVSGLADPRFRLSANFYGASALSMKDFQGYRQDLIVGGSVYVWAPWGQYDPSKLVNLGTNRWALKAELGISKAIGSWTLEFVPGITTYADNTDFLDGHKRRQDPMYSVQLHAIYGFESGVWVALDGTYFTGGHTSVDGVQNDDRLSNSRAGLTVAIPIDRSSSIKVYGISGISTRTEATSLPWAPRGNTGGAAGTRTSAGRAIGLQICAFFFAPHCWFNSVNQTTQRRCQRVEGLSAADQRNAPRFDPGPPTSQSGRRFWFFSRKTHATLQNKRAASLQPF